MICSVARPAEHVADEVSVGLDLAREVVHVVQPPDADAASRVGLCLVLQRGPKADGRRVPLAFPVQLEFVPVRIAAQIAMPDSRVAVLPADAEPGRLDRGDARLERRLARGPQPDPADAGGAVR